MNDVSTSPPTTPICARCHRATKRLHACVGCGIGVCPGCSEPDFGNITNGREGHACRACFEAERPRVRKARSGLLSDLGSNSLALLTPMLPELAETVRTLPSLVQETRAVAAEIGATVTEITSTVRAVERSLGPNVRQLGALVETSTQAVGLVLPEVRGLITETSRTCREARALTQQATEVVLAI